MPYLIIIDGLSQLKEVAQIYPFYNLLIQNIYWQPIYL